MRERETSGNNLITICKNKLIETKEDVLNRIAVVRQNLVSEESGGDEGDLSARVLAEDRNLKFQERMRHQLMEIEYALMRIHNNEYGICEETGEPIERERLLAIPWTRLSIEGAEIREATKKRYAK